MISKFRDRREEFPEQRITQNRVDVLLANRRSIRVCIDLDCLPTGEFIGSSSRVRHRKRIGVRSSEHVFDKRFLVAKQGFELLQWNRMLDCIRRKGMLLERQFGTVDLIGKFLPLCLVSSVE